jgi:uncharacterized coiled-coil protein SlyX
MEKYLDDLIEIIEESLSSEDLNKITNLEKKLQNLTEDFRNSQNSSPQDFKIDEAKVNHLSLLIKKFEANQEVKKNFLTEFDDFLKTRKFK